MVQAPKTVMGGASLSSKVWPPFMKTVQPIQSQPPAWHWKWKQSVSHPCPLLDCLKRWQSDHTCHHPHRFSELATESEKQNGKPRLECRHPPSNTPVGMLLWTCWSEGKWLSRQTGWQSNSHKWLASQKFQSAGELETLPVGTKPRTSHHWLPWGERHGKRKCLTIFHETEGMRESHCQSDEHWNYFKGNIGETPETVWAFLSM